MRMDAGITRFAVNIPPESGVSPRYKPDCVKLFDATARVRCTLYRLPECAMRSLRIEELNSMGAGRNPPAQHDSPVQTVAHVRILQMTLQTE